nr:MAG TPA: hypothetical protein [Caudoviricetes sp.]
MLLTYTNLHSTYTKMSIKKEAIASHSNNLNNFDFKQTFLAYYK